MMFRISPHLPCRHGFTVFLMSLMLSACGGGGGDDSGGTPTNPNAIYVNAGADIEVLEATDASLSGSATGNTDGATWRWSVTPSATITQDDNTVADAVFTAPVVTTDTSFVVTLTVTNSSGNSDSDTLNILVRPVNVSPTAVITPEQEAGQPQNTYSAGSTVELSGSASTDEDAPDSANPIAAWEWQQTSGNSVLNGIATDQPSITITMPVETSAQALTLTLTVTDAEGATDTATVTLNTLSESQTLPKVSAGNDQAVFSGERIVLNGVATTTVSAGLPLLSEWEASGSAGMVRDADTLSTYAIAPQVDVETQMSYTLAVSDAFGHIVYDEIFVTVRPMPVPLLNDTGVTVQANNTAYANTQQNDFPGQDGQRGGDVISAAGFLEKAGRGKAGFDFTKLNSNGDEEDDTSQAWSCVRDNITGLIWEKKTDDAGLRDADNTYSWFFSAQNGGYQGPQTTTTASCTMTNCNTQAYVSAVNAQGLCGFYDWRMPTHQELMSIIHFGQPSGVMLDDDYFPFAGTLAAGEDKLWYWTRMPSADGVSGDAAQNAWALDFASGLDNFLIKSSPARVRLVRAGR